jgi:hypothetical protein
VSAPLLSPTVDVEIPVVVGVLTVVVLVMRVRDMVGEVVTVVPRTDHSNSATHKQRLKMHSKEIRCPGLLGFKTQ